MDFLEIADQQGWTDATRVLKLLEYIENQNSPGAFDDFIQQAINNDSELSEEEETEPVGTEWVSTEKIVLSQSEFTELWTLQECDGLDNPKDTYQLINEIEEALDFEDMFEIIQVWSNKPLAERVNIFLERNNATLDEEGQTALKKVSSL